VLLALDVWVFVRLIVSEGVFDMLALVVCVGVMLEDCEGEPDWPFVTVDVVDCVATCEADCDDESDCECDCDAVFDWEAD
jgi:hypothetical protein